MTDEVNSGIYGSVTQDMEDLMTRKREVLKSIFRINAERNKSNVLSQQESAHARTYFIDLGEEDDDEKDQVKETMRDVIVIDDNCEIEDQGTIKAHTEIVKTAEEDEKTQLLSCCSKMQPTISNLVVNVVDRDIEEKSTTELPKETADIVHEAKEILEKDSSDRDLAEGQSLRNNSLMFGEENKVSKDIEDDVETKEGTDLSLEKDGSPLADENETGRSKGVYVGVEEDGIETDEGNNQPDSSDDDGLANIWKEMAIAQECSKDTTADPPSDERFIEGEDYCDHHFVVRDDIGDVCRICGIVKRGIEEIIEYQLPKEVGFGSLKEGTNSVDLIFAFKFQRSNTSIYILMLMLVMLDLAFDSEEAAKAFSEKHGWQYVVCPMYLFDHEMILVRSRVLPDVLVRS